LTLEVGDQLLLYTDGVTETQNELGEFFESRRLCQTFSAQRQQLPEETLQNILVRLREFRGGGAFLDDITMVSLSVN
jgi:sigma-B regulation protein RsbU (phosphoserine phosphatase)